MKHFHIVLKEMFKRVGEEYTFEKTKEEGWFMNHEWTKKEEDSFIKWLTDYLYKDKNARKELMRYPWKNKKKCETAAKWFNVQYGWKTKKQD